MQGVQGGFYQLCLQLVAVEVQVLLVEALRPSGPTAPGQTNTSVPMKQHVFFDSFHGSSLLPDDSFQREINVISQEIGTLCLMSGYRNSIAGT